MKKLPDTEFEIMKVVWANEPPMTTPVIMEQLGNADHILVPTPTGNALSTAVSNIPWWQIAATVWLVGMVLFLAYHLLKHYRFLKLAARWSEDITDEQMLELLENLKAQMGLSRKVGLQVCGSIGSPMFIGVLKPRIMLPNIDFTLEEFRFILKHELVHYKRKDLWPHLFRSGWGAGF